MTRDKTGLYIEFDKVWTTEHLILYIYFFKGSVFREMLNATSHSVNTIVLYLKVFEAAHFDGTTHWNPMWTVISKEI